MLNLSNAEAREWAMSGVHAGGKAGTELHKTPVPDAAPADFLTAAWSDPPSVMAAAAPEPARAADVDLLTDAWSTTPTVPAHDPGPSPDGVPAAVDPDDAVVGLRKAHEDHLPELTLAALRWARANDPDFPASVDKRGAELRYRVGDLKRWARNRPRADVGTTDAS